jgi:hypothetical protein
MEDGLAHEIHRVPRRAASRGIVDPCDTARKQVDSSRTMRTWLRLEGGSSVHPQLELAVSGREERGVIGSGAGTHPSQGGCPEPRTTTRSRLTQCSFREAPKPFRQAGSLSHLYTRLWRIPQAHDLV